MGKAWMDPIRQTLFDAVQRPLDGDGRTVPEAAKLVGATLLARVVRAFAEKGTQLSGLVRGGVRVGVLRRVHGGDAHAGRSRHAGRHRAARARAWWEAGRAWDELKQKERLQ